MATMKAVRIHGYGGAEQLRYEDAPVPSAGKGELVVRVKAAGVNPVDWKVREGYMKAFMPLTFPAVLGGDLSGTVQSVGEGVTGHKSGDDVFGRANWARGGAYAEFAIANAAEVAKKPKGLDHATAAALPIAALTAWQALFDAGGLGAGQKLLVHGGAGGVGSMAVQLAHWKGARVAATASARNADYLRSLGADEVIDYGRDRFEKRVKDADVVLDTIGGETQDRSWKALKKNGILVSIVGPPDAAKAAASGVRGVQVGRRADVSDLLKQIGELAASGKLKVSIEKKFPLREAAQAQDLSRTGHVRGKIVLEVA